MLLIIENQSLPYNDHYNEMPWLARKLRSLCYNLYYDDGYYHMADSNKDMSWCYKDQVVYATPGYEGIQYYSVERILKSLYE